MAGRDEGQGHAHGLVIRVNVKTNGSIIILDKEARRSVAFGNVPGQLVDANTRSALEEMTDKGVKSFALATPPDT